jgi:enoyl-CoA hydratase
MTDHAAPAAADHVNDAGTADGIRIGSRNAAGLVVLARPQARNAVSQAMMAALTAAYRRFARDPIIYAVVLRSSSAGVFSAGTDLDEIAGLVRQEPDALSRVTGMPLSLSWTQECFTKPTVSLIDGEVLGSGLGLSLFGTHRVAGEGFMFACPETAQGLIPGSGISTALVRMPSSIGVYLALTGRAIGRADAYRLGIATHCMPSTRFDAIEIHMADADPVDAILDGWHSDPGPGELPAIEAAIGRCFSAPTVEEIMSRLDAEAGEHATWAQETSASLRRRSPLALKVTHALFRQIRGMDLKSALELEYRVACKLTGQALQAGAGAPESGWELADLQRVGETAVAACFAEQPGVILQLPPRAMMQATGT